MNIQTFKKHLYKKERGVIKSLNLEDSIVQDDIEYFVLASFFQSYIEGRRYLAENFALIFPGNFSLISNFSKFSLNNDQNFF